MYIHLNSFMSIEPHCIIYWYMIVNKTFLLETGKLLYKLHTNQIIPKVGGYFEIDPYVNQHTYGLRSRTANVPTRLVYHTKSSENSLQIRGCKLWQSLPSDITNSESLHIFKRKFKTFLLETEDVLS